MTSQKTTLLVLALFLLSISGFAQAEKTKFTSLFKTMHAEQLKVAKAKKFTKTEVAAIDKAMLTAGKNINRALKAAPGQTHQYLVDKVNKEFRTLNSSLGRALSGDKLSAFRRVTNTQKAKVVRQLQTQYLGSSGASRNNMRAGMRMGIRKYVINGFGGDDPGW